MGRRLAMMISAAFALAPAAVMGQGRWIEAKCDIKPGHFLVNSGVLYLKDAANTRFDDKREKDMQDAYRVLRQALTSGGQEKNPAAWYYLGRYYVVRNDAIGADSAFDKAETLMPSCKEDTQFWRRNMLWVPAYNAGVAALQAGQYDSAVAAFRAANTAYSSEPQGFASLAAAFFNMPAGTFVDESTFKATHAGLSDSAQRAMYDSLTYTRYDSAAKYFRLAVQAAQDPKFAAQRRDATFNLGNAFYVARQYDSAAAAYADYLKDAPEDPQALTRLGDVLSAGGHQDSALSVYRAVVAHADSVDPLTLFNIGVSIYNAAPPSPDTATLGDHCRTEQRGGRTLTRTLRRQIKATCDSVTKQAVRDNDAVSAVNFRLAASAFAAGLARDPESRDGLYNLGNAFLALNTSDTTVVDSMLSVAQRLITVDPLNRGSMRLLAQAWQLKGKSDSALRYVTLADSLLPLDVTIGNFSPGNQNASISGLVTNFHSKPTSPMQITFEFLNGAGEAVATQTLDVPTLPAGANHPFQLQAAGSGIIAWRYKKTS